MTQLSLVLAEVGEPSKTADPKTDTALTTIQLWANGEIDANNLSAETAASAGLNTSGAKAKGASVIATEESRTNTAFGLLTTPDEVSVTLATNGLIEVRFQAQFASAAAAAGRAAIFIGATQLKVQAKVGEKPAEPLVQAAAIGNGENNWDTLCSFPGGLIGVSEIGSAVADVTTGQAVGASIVNTTAEGAHQELGSTKYSAVPGASAFSYFGGACHVFAAAGTYKVSVQFKATSSSVKARNRKLWVEARSFA